MQPGSQDLEAAIAEGALVVGRTLADPDRRQGDGQRRGIGEHVRCVG